MKTQFKYAFMAALNIRGPVFAVIFLMNSVFIIFGSPGLLPFPAHVTAVSLGGVAIAVMFAANIGSDVIMARRIFIAPDAYLQMLTPVPRGKILLANVLVMALFDLLTLFFVIFTEVWMAFNLAGLGIRQMVWEIFSANLTYVSHGLWLVMMLTAGYFLVMMIIMFCVTAKKSFLFKKPASGFLAFLVACVCFYINHLLQIVLAPFGEVSMHGPIIVITAASGAAFPVLLILTLAEAAVLFAITSKLLEKVNI